MNSIIVLHISLGDNLISIDVDLIEKKGLT